MMTAFFAFLFAALVPGLVIIGDGADRVVGAMMGGLVPGEGRVLWCISCISILFGMCVGI
jgi:hypothetical protein